ncbi:MAG: hypothetical protein C5B51_30480 [Terriglobia bacterium]|nr:MAG: hypothetical protein C5B51_30480 [Terriglobia bacterium]
MLIWDRQLRVRFRWRRQRATGPTRTLRRASLTLSLAAVLVLAHCGGTNPVREADSLRSQRKQEAALQAVEQGLGRQTRGTQVYWELALRRSQILEELNRREHALAWLESLSPLRGAPQGLAVLLIREQADIEKDLGRFREADRHLTEALAMAPPRTRITANLKVRRARVLIRLDRAEEAEACLREAEEYSRASGDHSLDPYILHYRGEGLLAKNQFEDAIDPLARSFQQFLAANNQAFAAKLLISEAWCYYRLGQIDKALQLYQQALQMAAPEDRHLVLGHLGNISLEDRDFAKAADYYRLAAAGAKGRDQNYYPRWLDNLALALIEQGKWAEAERVNSEVLELENHIDGSPGLAMALVNQGRIETSKGNYETAEKTLRQVAESQSGDSSFALDAYSALADLDARQAKPDEVKRQFEAATALADRVRDRLREDENKITYLASLTNVHRKYVDFLMDRGDEEGAFAAAESSRARLLRERLDLPGSKVRSYELAKYKAAARAGETTFLAYWIGPERSYLWAVSASRFATYRLPGEAEIRRLVERHQRAIERGGSPRADDRAAGEKLFHLLVPEPLRQDGGSYLIVPDGPLYALNFETLPVGGIRPHFWIEDATVAVAPSLDLLLGREAKPIKRRSVLLVGDAAEWNPEFPKLLHARQEMEGIGQLFPAVERKILSGAEATPVAYQRSKPENYTFIHFSAHATANKNSPFDSAIILSREKGLPTAKGRLSVKEVLSNRVTAELVTISACHSAGARTYAGEGLVGFAWAFLQSGAQSVIAGIWDVSDYSSPLLMLDLYAGLAGSKDPAEALRAAKLRLIAGGKYADPYYWGALQLYEGALYPGARSRR